MNWRSPEGLLGVVRSEAARGVALRSDAGRCGAARCEAERVAAVRRVGLGLTPFGCPAHQSPFNFGVCFPAFFSNLNCFCAPCADAAMNECTLIRF
jgi:hypothetical protein